MRSPVACAALVVVACTSAAAAASPSAIFVKIDGIMAETDSCRECGEGAIEAISFRVGGEAVEGCRAAAHSDNMTMADVDFTKSIDKASPKLAEVASKGESFEEIKVTFVDGPEHCQMLLHSVEGISIEPADDRTERVSLRVGHIAFAKGSS